MNEAVCANLHPRRDSTKCTIKMLLQEVRLLSFAIHSFRQPHSFIFPESELHLFCCQKIFKVNKILTMSSIIRLGVLIVLSTILTSLSQVFALKSVDFRQQARGNRFSGAVYAMTNNLTRNSISAFGRMPNGQLVPLGDFETGERGAIIPNTDGFDPLSSAGSVVLVRRKYVLAVNAGSASISVFKILKNFQLRLVSTASVAGFGPISIAVSGNIVYVAIVDGDGTFEAFREQQGTVTGFKLTRSGRLLPIAGSTRSLGNRPSTVKFSPDGFFLVVSSIFAGAAELRTDTVDELLVFNVTGNGLLSQEPVESATSTQLNNPSGRNLPCAVGIETVRWKGIQYVIAAETRFIAFDGQAAESQTGSVSSWKLTSAGKLQPVDLDVLIGRNASDGQIATCWLQFSPTLNTFWVSNTASNTLSSFSFSAGRLRLLQEVVARGDLPTDLSQSRDGKFFYHTSFAGSIGVLEVGNNGRGTSLTPIQTLDVLDTTAQGIVAF